MSIPTILRRQHAGVLSDGIWTAHGRLATAAVAASP